MSVNSNLNVTQIAGQRKAFYRHRSPEFSCASKETIDIDIFIISTNDKREIRQSNRITSRPSTRTRKWNQFNQFR